MNPIESGCFIFINIILKIIIINVTNKVRISRNSLFKILILEIIDKGFSFFLKF